MIDARYGYNFHNQSLSSSEIFDIVLNVLFVTIPLFFIVLRRKRYSLYDIVVHASFFAYAVIVFNLTLYVIPFSDFFNMITHIRSYSWQDYLATRLNYGIGFNYTPFKIFTHYDIWDTQIVGNFLMLMPLGVYFHLIYRKRKTFVHAFALFLFVALSIESLQFVFSYLIPYAGIGRSADIDDVILNTLGACIAYIIMVWLTYIFNRQRSRITTHRSNTHSNVKDGHIS